MSFTSLHFYRGPSPACPRTSNRSSPARSAANPIALTELLAAPLVATEAKYKLQLRMQADTFAQKERTLAGQQQALDQRAQELETAARKQEQEIAQAVQGQLQQRLVAERWTNAEQETVRARKED